MFLKSWVNFSRPRTSFISLARACFPSLFLSLPLSLFLLPSHCLFVVCGEHLERHLSFNCLRIGLIIARALILCWCCPSACPPLTPRSPHLCHLSTRLLIYLYSRPRLIFSLTLWQVATPPLPSPPPPSPLAVPLLLLLALLPSLLLVSPLRTHLSSRFVSLYFKLLFLFPFSLFPLLFLC